MTEEKERENESEQLVVKRVIKSEIWLMLDDDVLKALSNNVPIRQVLNDKQMNVIKASVKTEGPLEINIVRKKRESE